MKKNSGVLLYEKAKKIIPGGTQLLSKRPELFLPGEWPAYYKKCKGSSVWDLDNNRYIDFSISGVGACVLGYGDPNVDAAVTDAVAAGNMCTLNAPEEVDLAQLLCGLHPWAEMVRYGRCGGEAMAIAVRIARAYSGKEKILFCGYHGWHDWYLSANLAQSSALDGQLLPGLEPRGVPRGLQGTALPFTYNDCSGFMRLWKAHKLDVAAVVMEPVRNNWPEKGFLETIRQETKKVKVPLIFDEVTSGFRMNTGGIHMMMKVYPDIAVFAKALGNGYPMAAIIGTGAIMSAAQKSFISSTYWTDRIGPAAAAAMIRKHKKCNAGLHLTKIGDMVQSGWKKLAAKHGISMHVGGISPLSHWAIQHEDASRIHTAIISKMLAKGFLTSKAFYASYAHTTKDVRSYLTALDGVMAEVGAAIAMGKTHELYSGELAHSGFKRLN